MCQREKKLMGGGDVVGKNSVIRAVHTGILNIRVVGLCNVGPIHCYGLLLYLRVPLILLKHVEGFFFVCFVVFFPPPSLILYRICKRKKCDFLTHAIL